MSSDLKKQVKIIVRACEAQGFRVQDNGKSFIVYGKAVQDGRVTLHKTPSDVRGMRNAVAALRRMGVEL